MALLHALNRADLIPNLYAYLTKTQYPSPEQKSHLSDRLKDAIFKLMQIVGNPRTLQAITNLATAERIAQTPPSTFHWRDLQFTPEIRDRGIGLLRRMYGGITPQDMASVHTNLGQHFEDFDWLATNLAYGMFLSDNRMLGPVETELVILSGMMCEGVRNAQVMHLKGIMGLGVKREVVGKVLGILRVVAENLGSNTADWERLEGIVDVREQGMDVPFKG